MDNLTHFLTTLAVDPKMQGAFVKAPEALMDTAGLSRTQKTALASRDRAMISALFTTEFFQAGNIFVMDPGPDTLPDPDPPQPPDPSEGKGE